jgi:tetratricopeptide (TPR) repeat protein
MGEDEFVSGRRRNRASIGVPVVEGRFEKADWVVALLLVVVVLVAYTPVWHAGFIWDDDDHLTANPAMTAPHGLRTIWSSLAASRYYPLTLTSLWIQRRLWGLNPLPYHLVNVALHAINGVLVFLLLRRLRVTAAWFAAMLWLLHPVNVESVAWITELKNTQSGVFFFLAAICFLRSEVRKRWPWYTLALVCGLAAMLSKPSTVVLPVVLLLCVWRERNRWRRADIVRIAPFFAMAFGMSVLTVLEQREHILKGGIAEWNPSLAERFVVAGQAVWFYAAKLFWPAKLTFVYPRWEVQADSLVSWLPLAGLVAGAVLLWAWRHQFWARAGLFGLSCFVTGLLPVLGFFDVYYFRYSLVADHFQYLASIALMALVAGAATEICRRGSRLAKRIGMAAGAVILIVLGALTWRRADVYRDTESLWRDTLAKNPDCWMAHNNMGDLLSGAGQVQEAIRHYEQALRINARLAETHYNLGNALCQAGMYTNAIAHYEQALRIRPRYAEAHNNLGSALQQMGRPADAIEQYQQSLRIEPDLAVAHDNLGNALFQMGRVQEAIQQYAQALRIKPDLAETRNNLGSALFQVGRIQEAIGSYRQALRIRPDYAEAHCNLAGALQQAGDLDGAIGHYEAALRINPRLTTAYYNLGNLLFQVGRTDDAIRQYEHALRIDPGIAAVQFSLGNACFKAGRLENAIAHYEQALHINPGDADAWFNLGLVLTRTGRPQKAVRCYEEVMRIKPDDIKARNNLARLLAMLPPAMGGDAARAITLAQQACKLTGGGLAAYVDTLAIAYAADGQFDNAIATAEKAIQLAVAAGQPQWVAEIEARIELYRSGCPYAQFADSTGSNNQ